MVSVNVDDDARIDIQDLEHCLDASLNEERAVFAIVANMGSNKEGAVDALMDIVALCKKKIQDKGRSFVIHADAAWGGHFVSMLPPDYTSGTPFQTPRLGGELEGFVPVATVWARTQEHIFAIRKFKMVSLGELIKDEEAMNLLQAIGSDLNIDAFALNFQYFDGTLNTKVEEVNYLNRRVVERLSIESPNDDPIRIDFFLSWTEFTHSLYGECAKTFKARLGLDRDERDLFVLRNCGHVTILDWW